MRIKLGTLRKLIKEATHLPSVPVEAEVDGRYFKANAQYYYTDGGPGYRSRYEYDIISPIIEVDENGMEAPWNEEPHELYEKVVDALEDAARNGEEEHERNSI